MPVPGLVSAVGHHPLAVADPAGARALSELLLHSVTPGTKSTYASAFSQLVHFCAARGMQPLPVDSVTLAAWLSSKADQGVKAKSLSKYVSGIRHANILHLGRWNLHEDPIVAMALRSVGGCLVGFPQGDGSQREARVPVHARAGSEPRR